MTMPGGGDRLDIEVVADASGFAKGLQAKIDAQVRGIKARIQAEVDTARLQAQAAAAARRVEAQTKMQLKVGVDAKYLRESIKGALAGITGNEYKVKIGVDIDTGRVQRALDEATSGERDAKVKVDVDADTTTAKEDIDRFEVEEKAKPPIKRKVKVEKDQSSFDQVESAFKKVGDGVGVIGAPIRGLIGLFGNFTTIAMGAAAVAAPGLLAIAAAASQAVGVVGALPAAMSGVLQIGGALMAGFKGIGGALSAMSAQDTSGAQQARSNASSRISALQGVAAAQQHVKDVAQSSALSIKQAEDSVASAQHNALQAQLALTQARQDAATKLRDYRLQLSGAKLDEEAAQLAVQEAKLNLDQANKNPASTQLQRQEADLGLRQAEQHLSETQQSNSDLSAQAAKDQALGVDGAQPVVDATYNAAQASKGVDDSQAALVRAQAQASRDAADASQSLANAERQLADVMASTSAGSSALSQALAKLSPAGRAFVTFIHDELMPKLKDLSQGVQQAMLPGFQAGIKAAMPLLDTLKTGLVGTGAVLGNFATDAGQLMGSPLFRGDVATIMDSNNRALGSFSGAGLNIIEILKDLAVAAGPMIERFANWTKTLTDGWKATADTNTENGKLTTFFQKAGDTLAQLGRILGNVAGGLFGFFRQGTDSGQSLLDKLEAVTKKFKDFTNTDEGKKKIKDFFDSFAPLAATVGDIAKKIGDIIVNMGADKGGGLKQLLDKIDRIVTAIDKFTGTEGGKKAVTILGEISAAAAIAGPTIGRIGAGIGGLGKAISGIGKAVDFVGGLRDSAKAMEDGATQATKAGAKVADWGSKVGDFVTDSGIKIAGWGRSIAGAATDAGTKIGGWASSAASSVGDFASSAGTKMSGWASSAGSAIGSVGSKVGELAGKFASSVGAAAKAGAAWAATGAKSILSAIGGVASSIGTVISNFSKSVLKAAEATAAWIATNAAKAAAAVVDGILTAAEWLLNIALDANPIVLIVLAIIGLIAFIVLLILNVGGLRDKMVAAFDWIKDKVVAAFDWVKDKLSAAWDWITSHVDFGKFRDLIVGAFEWVRDKVVGAFEWVRDQISKIWNDIKKAVRDPLDAIINVAYNHGIVPVYNWINDLWGGTDLKEYHLPQFATGGVHDPARDGRAIPGYAPGRDTALALLSPGEGVLVPEAVRGIAAALGTTASGAMDAINGAFSSRVSGPTLGGGMPAFAGGGLWDDIKGAAGSVWNAASSAVGDVLSGAKNLISKGWQVAVHAATQPIRAMSHLIPGSGAFGEGMRSSIGGWMDSFESAVGGRQRAHDTEAAKKAGNVPGSVSRWAGTVSDVLRELGQSQDALPWVLQLIAHESGGNPLAINKTDINAQRGDPSRGLVQTIGSTFNAYAGPHRSAGIYDPYANLYAGLAYGISRYHSVMNIPGIKSLASGGGYKPYDQGGRWPDGTTGINTSGTDEGVLTGKGMGALGGFGKLDALNAGRPLAELIATGNGTTKGTKSAPQYGTYIAEGAVQQHIENPVPETATDTLNRQMRRLSELGIFGGGPQ